MTPEKPRLLKRIAFVLAASHGLGRIANEAGNAGIGRVLPQASPTWNSRPDAVRAASSKGVRGFDEVQPVWYLDKGQIKARTLLSSSMAEHSAVNRRVVGSSPT
jgi:hypothetical protein